MGRVEDDHLRLVGNCLGDPLDGQPITEIWWHRDDALPFALCLSALTDQDHGGALIEIDNVMSANFAVLRPSQIPALLGIEAVKPGATLDELQQHAIKA